MSRTRSLASVSLVLFGCSGQGVGEESSLGEERAALTVASSIVNASFEDDNNGVASPLGWTSTGSVNADFTEWGGSAGNWRLSHWSPDAYSVDTTQTITGLADGVVTVRVQARRSTGNNNAYVDLDCGRDSGRVYVPVSWPSQWLEVVASARVKRGSCTVSLHTDGDAGEWTNFDNVRLESGQPKLSVLGADVSSLKKSEDFGGEYHDGRGRRHRHHHCGDDNALDMLEDHGANTVRLRVWVDPADGYHDLAELREMARRAHRQDLKVLVDLHYSDRWADPSHQTKPAAWASYSTEQLRQAVYDHTYQACRAASVHGRGPAMIQLGNELNAGMLWPDGHTFDPPNYDNLASFLQAGYDAVKACSPSTKVALHLANGGDNGLYRWWFDNITQRGVQFDIIAASFYNYWHGGLGDLQWNLNDVSSRYGKDVMVVETAYPFTLGWEDDQSNVIGLESQLVAGYPATPEGQARNFRDVMSIVRAVPNGRGLGVFYWDATWTAVAGNGWDPEDPSSGDTWENQALFDFDDRPLPAMDEFRP